MRGEIFDSATDHAEFAKSAHKIHVEISPVAKRVREQYNFTGKNKLKSHPQRSLLRFILFE
jgi:hypothetical protein